MYRKYEELFWDIVVGLCATFTSLGAKYLCNFLFFGFTLYPNDMQVKIFSAVSWVTGVATSYPLSRKLVFKSHGPMIPEIISFVISRLSTWALDLLITSVAGPGLIVFGKTIIPGVNTNIHIATIASMVLVVILNYVFSKVFVFKKKEPAEAKEEEKEEKATTD